MSCDHCSPHPTAADWANSAAQDAQRQADRLGKVIMLIAEKLGIEEEAQELMEPPRGGGGMDIATASEVLKRVYTPEVIGDLVGGSSPFGSVFK